jgi:hypothetical protein
MTTDGIVLADVCALLFSLKNVVMNKLSRFKVEWNFETNCHFKKMANRRNMRQVGDARVANEYS